MTAPLSALRSERPPGAAQRTAAPARSEGSTLREPVAVPAHGRFSGLLSFRGAACVEGSLTGEVVARGRLRIGPNARVEGRIEVDEVIAEGFVRGDIHARERVELTSTARVEGTIEAPRVVLRDGCQLRGRCCSGPAARGRELR